MKKDIYADVADLETSLSLMHYNTSFIITPLLFGGVILRITLNRLSLDKGKTVIP
jgi:hypothetical protein